MENHQILITIVTLIISFIVILITAILVKKQEDKKQTINPLESNPYQLFYIGVFVFLILSIGLLNYGNKAYPFILILKIFFSISVGSSAKSMNRNKVVWGILGFINTGAALIILGNSNFLIESKNKEDANLLITEFNDSESSLDNLYYSNLISEEEYHQKKSRLKENFQNRLSRINKNPFIINFQEEIQEISNEEKIKQLLEALEKGIISKKEYEEKREHLS